MHNCISVALGTLTVPRCITTTENPELFSLSLKILIPAPQHQLGLTSLFTHSLSLFTQLRAAIAVNCLLSGPMQWAALSSLYAEGYTVRGPYV